MTNATKEDEAKIMDNWEEFTNILSSLSADNIAMILEDKNARKRFRFVIDVLMRHIWDVFSVEAWRRNISTFYFEEPEWYKHMTDIEVIDMWGEHVGWLLKKTEPLYDRIYTILNDDLELNEAMAELLNYLDKERMLADWEKDKHKIGDESTQNIISNLSADDALHLVLECHKQALVRKRKEKEKQIGTLLKKTS